MLKNLNELALKAKENRDKYNDEEIKIGKQFIDEFYRRFPSSKMKFFEFTCVDYTPQNLAIVIPNQWFIIASFFTAYLAALIEYKKIVNELGFTKDEITSFRDNKVLDQNSTARIKNHLSEVDANLMITFLTDYNWWFGSKTVDRGDFFVSSILNLASVVHITQGHIAFLTQMLIGNEDLISLLNQTVENVVGKNITPHEDLKLAFAQWLVDNKNNNYFGSDLEKTLKGISIYQERYSEEFGKDIFEIDWNQLDDEIKLIRENIWNEESSFWQFSKTQSTHQPRAILGNENYLRFLKVYNPQSETPILNGFNKIYFGAPGTGKSYAVSEQLKVIDESQIERVIFHPDYDYSSFIGGYKPVTERDEDGVELVKYKFVPQVFINIFEKAHRNPNKNYYLIIEEINRGNCAEIFGDVFQLLDRNPNYAITPSEDLFHYLSVRDLYASKKVLLDGKLVMPSNLILLATMNTSDQSLFPMDSAFKRRWDWEYVPIKYPTNDLDNSCPSFQFIIELGDKKFIRWIDFIAAINHHIQLNPSLGMDKCVGNFFVKPDSDNIISLSTLINKVIFYLWNDVFKDEENEIFVDHTYQNYFPISTNGLKHINHLIDKLQIVPKDLYFFENNKNEPIIEQEVIPFTQQAGSAN